MASIFARYVGGTRGGAGGNVVGPSSSTPNAVAVFADSSGQLLANTNVLIQSGNLSLLTTNALLKVDGYVASAGETVNGNSGSAVTIDFSTQSAQEVKFTANCTVTLANPHVGGAYLLRVVNDGTARTITWPGNVLWSGGTAPTLTGTANKVDLINFYYDGTKYYGSFSLNY